MGADYLREHYLGHVPLFSPYHAGSETFYGINFDLQEPEISYTAMTAINFFEFIPVDQIESDNPTTLLCHQVKVGEQYEIVVTTYEGLYRYRTEDLVEITGFRGTIPKYKFIRRTGDVLSTITERVPETLLSRALKNAVAKWDNKTLIDFISTESINLEYSSGEVSEQPYYVMFVEIRNNVLMLESEKAMVDEELLKLHEIYANFRTNNKIGPLKVIQVKTGSFEDIANIIIKMNDNNTVRTQYKLPRIIRRPPLLEFLQSNTVT